MSQERSRGSEALTSYLALMNSQREAAFESLAGIGDETLWDRSTTRDWSVGENLDHLRVINGQMLKLFKIAWVLLQPLARLRRHKPYDVEIDNVYKRPGFPLNTGWIWHPKHTPSRPVPFSVLRDNLAEVHRQTERAYLGKNPDLLGHTSVWDPVMGWLNLIRGLRVMVYHDELHYEQIQATIERLGTDGSDGA